MRDQRLEQLHATVAQSDWHTSPTGGVSTRHGCIIEDPSPTGGVVAEDHPSPTGGMSTSKTHMVRKRPQVDEEGPHHNTHGEIEALHVAIIISRHQPDPPWLLAAGRNGFLKLL